MSHSASTTADGQPGIFVGKGERPQHLLLRYANRHGLIAGATGTGKTVTLQILAEGFSAAGVPVFAADVKGDLSGIGAAGEPKSFIAERAAKIGLAGLVHEPSPTTLWDVFGEKGHPIRATISEMGPVLLSRLLDLNDVQEGVLNIAFRIADEQGLLLLDLKDLRAILAHVADQADELTRTYGNVSKTSVGAIQRALLVLEQQGAEKFFGEPALDLNDFMRVNAQGRGQVNVLAADRLFENPRLYATFLLWLLSELFEALPEAGDLEKPKLVFFFDEAHLLFTDAPRALLEKVTQVVRLIRSKGVGVWFVTQNPQDVPDIVAAQLGNRIQHALRAYTPKEMKAVSVAAESFRPNPAFETKSAITELGVGEALTSLLEDKAVPGIVERTLVRPPASRIGPLLPDERARLMAGSAMAGRYDRMLDRDSAFEMLQRRSAERAPPAPPPSREPTGPFSDTPSVPRTRTKAPPRKSSGRSRQSVGEAFTKSVVRSVGSSLGRRLVRGILGSLTGRG
ncbi:MAG TPA: DUF853 family protein [Micropepsaceae bacterium]|nr:DUF853 family protein [Micropepsaceae bacterium]